MRAAAGPPPRPLPAPPRARAASPGAPRAPPLRPQPALCGGERAASSLVCVVREEIAPAACRGGSSFRSQAPVFLGSISRVLWAPFSALQICNLGMWITWAAELRRFFVSRSWKGEDLFALTPRDMQFVRSENPIVWPICQSRRGHEHGRRTATGPGRRFLAVAHLPLLDKRLSRVNR